MTVSGDPRNRRMRRCAPRPADTHVEAVHEPAWAALADADRQWFAEHPDEVSRVRPPAPHELCNPRCVDGCSPTAPAGQVQIVVTQLEPGVRLRSWQWIPGDAS